jgi:hypothetical protein
VIDVSDLYDAFHAIAQSIWRDFGMAVDDESWDDIIDSLEQDLFLAACAQRLAAGSEEVLEPDEMPARIRLMSAGAEVPGAPGQYHSHAFYPDDESGVVPNAVMTGNLMSRDRADVTLVIAPHGAARRTRGAQLPQIP